MTLERLETEFSFAGGIDQKQQVELQSADSMRDQVNTRFDELGACEKRITAVSYVGSLDSDGSVMHTLVPRKNEIAVLSTKNGLYRYDAANQTLREVKRDANDLYKSTPCEVSRAFTVDTTASSRGNAIACAVRTNYVAVAYLSPDGVRCRIFDEDTGTVFFESDVLTTYASKQIRCIRSEYPGNEGFFVFYETSATNIDVAWVDLTAPTATSLGTIINDHRTTNDHQWDVVAEGGYLAYRIAYNNTTGAFGTLLGKRFQSNTLLSTHTASHSARYGCCIVTDNTNWVIVSAHGDAGVPTLTAEPWGTPASLTTLYTLTTTVTQAFRACFGALDLRAGNGYAIVGAGVYQPTVLASIATTGTIALMIYLPNLALGVAYTTLIPSAMVAANAFTMGERAYLPVALTKGSGLQSITPANVVLGFYTDSGSLRTYAVARYNHDARYTLAYGTLGSGPAGTTYVFINSPVVANDGTSVYIPGGGDDQERRVHKIDFNPPPLGRAEYGDGAYLANGVFQHYDGSWITEQQWLGAPACALADGGAGGTFGAGTYQGTVYRRWVDMQGNLHRSTASDVVEVTLGGAGRYIEIFVLKPPTAPRTYAGATDDGAALEVFLTEAGGSTPVGVIFSYVGGDAWYSRYLCTDVGGGTRYNHVTFNSAIYTSGGELESQSPPSFVDVALVGDRMWGINAENRRQVWPSKPIEPGYAVEWASELAITLAEEGELLRVFELSGILIVISTTGVWEIRGAGPNKNNVGSFEPPRKVHRFTARGRASAVATPDGIAIGRADGWCILGPDLSLRDIGTPIAPFLTATQDGTASLRSEDARAVYHPEHREIRVIGTYGDDVLVYNMLHGKWSRWTLADDSFAQNDGAFIAGRYWSFFANQLVGEWVQGIDGPQANWLLDIATTQKTPWIRLDGITGFGRLWRIVVALRILNSAVRAGLRIALEYDYGEEIEYIGWNASAITALLPASYDSYVAHLTIHPGKQRIKAIRMTAEETPLGETSEPSWQLLSARLIYGVRRGGAKLANDTARRGPSEVA